MKKDSKLQQITAFNNLPLRYVAFETFMWNRPEILNLFYRKSLRFAILNCPRLGSIMNGKLGKRFICYLTGSEFRTWAGILIGNVRWLHLLCRQES